MTKKIVVFVHGWSVHNTDTYGELPARLTHEALIDKNIALDVVQIWLGKYISFQDEVRLDDISRAFESALRNEIGDKILTQKCVCITHSTGGPVVRNWIDQFYVKRNRISECPVSHLIMLAPANFGSALAQIGKSRLARLSSLLEGIEPGQGVLDWLEMGSPESWKLNTDWINYSSDLLKQGNIFPFVISGQSINRKFYDQINSYTGELGSDGVVRMCAANLNTAYIRLEQELPENTLNRSVMLPLLPVQQVSSAKTAFLIAKGCSHSGDEMGIIRSVKNNGKPHPTVTAILNCIKIENSSAYNAACDQFDQENKIVRDQEMVEIERVFLKDRIFIHDRNSMVIFRIQDDYGYPIGNFDLRLTANNNDPNHLPEGFFIDRQRNSRNSGTLTYYFNHAVMLGSEAVIDKKTKKTLRPPLPGSKSLGFIIEPHQDNGFVHFLPGMLNATKEQLDQIIKPDQTTLIDVVMRRIVHSEVFQLTQNKGPEEFKNTEPGTAIAD